MTNQERSPLPPCPTEGCLQPHVVRNGSSKGRARYHCRRCGRYFGETEGTPLYRWPTPVAKIAQALLMVMRRGSVRGAEEVTGHTYETIRTWLYRAADHAAHLSAALEHDLQLSTVEIDEFWSFVRKIAPPDEANAGERWGGLVQERESRFIVAAVSGHIGAPLVAEAVQQTAERTNQQPLAWCSDGWQGYAQVLTQQYRQPQRTGKRGRPRWQVPDTVPLTQTIKHRDEHGHLVSIEVRSVLGTDLVLGGTVQVERLNGGVRDRLNALTRKTHAFAKCDAPWDALLRLQVFEHNGLRPHSALRQPIATDSGRRYLQRSPAMARHLTEHIWSWESFLTTRCPITSS